MLINITKGPTPYIFVGAFFIFLLLFPFPESQTTFRWNSTFDAGHLPLFFLANIALMKFIASCFKKMTDAPLISSLSLFSIGVLIEFAQPYFNRGFSYRDMSVNLLGILLSYLLFSSYKNKFRMFKYLLIFATIYVTVPIGNSYVLYKLRVSSFPVLFDPETKLIEVADSSYESELVPEPLNCGLRVTPSDFPWSGVEIDFGYTNWTQFNLLRITLSNPNDAPLTLSLRIDDNGNTEEYDSRYNDTVIIPSNQTVNLEVPIEKIKREVASREFNLEMVEGALIFPSNSASPFCVGKIELK